MTFKEWVCSKMFGCDGGGVKFSGFGRGTSQRPSWWFQIPWRMVALSLMTSRLCLVRIILQSSSQSFPKDNNEALFRESKICAVIDACESIFERGNVPAFHDFMLASLGSLTRGPPFG